MAIRIMADAMILEIDNRVGEHAGADGKWGMDQVGPARGQTFAAIRPCG
jgi:hypothetical protein